MDSRGIGARPIPPAPSSKNDARPRQIGLGWGTHARFGYSLMLQRKFPGERTAREAFRKTSRNVFITAVRPASRPPRTAPAAKHAQFQEGSGALRAAILFFAGRPTPLRLNSGFSSFRSVTFVSDCALFRLPAWLVYQIMHTNARDETAPRTQRADEESQQPALNASQDQNAKP